MATEVELKLRCVEANKSVLTELEAFIEKAFPEAELSTRYLENRYLDTPDFALNKARVALRIRSFECDGERHYIQTLKTQGEVKDGVHTRKEHEWQVPNLSLNIDLLNSCEDWPEQLKADCLITVFDTNFTRYSAVLEHADSKIELAYDQGAVSAELNGEVRKTVINELELELLEGDAAALVSLSEQLKAELALVPSDTSKAERGFKLYDSSTSS